MTVLYHPSFPEDIRRFAHDYAAISAILGPRFRTDVDLAIAAVIESPTAAGHFVQTGSSVVREVRRRNLAVFPFFILYAVAGERLIFASLIPGASDPIRWMERFQ